MLVAQDANSLLLDEPISALDIAHQIEILSMIRDLAHLCPTAMQAGGHWRPVKSTVSVRSALEGRAAREKELPGRARHPGLSRLFGIHGDGGPVSTLPRG